MNPDQEHLREWEELIDAADKSNIPMHFIRHIYIYMNGQSKPRLVDVAALRDQGYRSEQIEEIINQTLLEIDGVNGVDFALDIEAVASIVQKHTEEILHNIK